MLKNILLELLYIPCAGFRWYRRWAGGHWELWFVDRPVGKGIWHFVSDCSQESGHKPTPLCFYLEACENHIV